MDSQGQVSQRRLEREAAALVRPVDGATVDAPRSRSRERIHRQQGELQELRRQLAEALADQTRAPIGPIREVRLVDDMLEQQDQQSFRQIMREKRLPVKYYARVETLLSEARQRGENPSREALLKQVIGGEALDKRDRAAERQRQRGQRRIQRMAS